MDIKLEVSSLDTLKTFDNVQHEGLHCRLKKTGVLANHMTDFLYERKERVVLNGARLTSANVRDGRH